MVPRGRNTKSEEFMGRVLKGVRDEVLIATKFGLPYDDDHQGGAKPDYIRRSLEGSLRRLDTDHIDLYQLHAPDPETPIAETPGRWLDIASLKQPFFLCPPCLTRPRR